MMPVRVTAVNAFKEYVKTAVKPRSPLAAVHDHFFVGQSTAEIELPALVFECSQARELVPGTGMFEADLKIMVMNEAAPNADAEATQASMLNQLVDIVADMETVRAALNPPESGPDKRPVKDFRVHGYWIDDESGQALENHWVDVITLKVHCQSAD